MCGGGGGAGGFLKMAAPLASIATGNPLGLALALGGTALNAGLQHRANEDKQQAIAQSIQRQGEHDREIVRKVNEFLPEMNAEQRTENFDQAAQEQEARIAEALARAQERGSGHGEVSSNPAGRVSENFQKAEAESLRRSTKDAAELARLIGRIRAPMVMKQDEGFVQARLASDIGQQRNFARGDARADEVAIAEAGEVSPIGTAIAGLMQGAGTGMLSSAAVPAAAGATTGVVQAAGAAPSAAGLMAGGLSGAPIGPAAIPTALPPGGVVKSVPLS